jgi:molybdenum cofactor guanylyltransferase
MTTFDLVVLAGGTSSRMSTGDKTQLDVGGLSLLDRVLAAGLAARRRLVVGDPRPVHAQGVRWTREDPPGSGPAAAVSAGLANCTAPVVALLAGDLPFVTPALLDRLTDAVTTGAGAVAIDLDGQEQWLFSAWPVDLLIGAPLVAGGSLRAALSPLPAARVEIAGASTWDVDTPEDLERARRLAATAIANERGQA